jgi:hypothetical protein
VHTRFWKDNLKERDFYEDSGTDGRIDLQEIGLEGVHWIHLAQDRDWWHTLVNMAMNLRIP